jgi:hypothetical protein
LLTELGGVKRISPGPPSGGPTNPACLFVFEASPQMNEQKQLSL